MAMSDEAGKALRILERLGLDYVEVIRCQNCVFWNPKDNTPNTIGECSAIYEDGIGNKAYLTHYAFVITEADFYCMEAEAGRFCQTCSGFGKFYSIDENKTIPCICQRGKKQ